MSDHEDGQAVPETQPKQNLAIDWVEPPPCADNNALVLKLDIEKYIDQFSEFDLTEEQKVDVLKALWQIMSRFVEMGFGLDSVSLACEQKGKTTGLERDILLESDYLEQADAG